MPKTLEDWKTLYYEQQAQHTEANGMLVQERNRAIERAELAEKELRAAREMYAKEISEETRKRELAEAHGVEYQRERAQRTQLYEYLETMLQVERGKREKSDAYAAHLVSALESVLGTVNAAQDLRGYDAPMMYKLQAIESIAASALARKVNQMSARADHTDSKVDQGMAAAPSPLNAESRGYEAPATSVEAWQRSPDNPANYPDTNCTCKTPDEYAACGGACLRRDAKPMPDPFDCQEFHELCMDYRGAPPGLAQGAYERLQAYCHATGSVDCGCESYVASCSRDGCPRNQGRAVADNARNAQVSEPESVMGLAELRYGERNKKGSANG